MHKDINKRSIQILRQIRWEEEEIEEKEFSEAPGNFDSTLAGADIPVNHVYHTTSHSDAFPISCLRVNGPASSPVEWWQVQLVRAVFFVVYLTDVGEGVALDLARDVILIELSEGLELLRKLGLEQLVIILPQCIFPLLHNLADN